MCNNCSKKWRRLVTGTNSENNFVTQWKLKIAKIQDILYPGQPPHLFDAVFDMRHKMREAWNKWNSNNASSFQCQCNYHLTLNFFLFHFLNFVVCSCGCVTFTQKSNDCVHVRCFLCKYPKLCAECLVSCYFLNNNIA